MAVQNSEAASLVRVIEQDQKASGSQILECFAHIFGNGQVTS